MGLTVARGMKIVVRVASANMGAARADASGYTRSAWLHYPGISKYDWVFTTAYSSGKVWKAWISRQRLRVSTLT
jgi:hypothetical protein